MKDKLIKIFVFVLVALGLLFAAIFVVSAHNPRIVYNQGGEIVIENPEISQAFYDELGGAPRFYFLTSDKEFNLYINLLIPFTANGSARYSANVYSVKGGTEPDENIAFIDGQNFVWQEFYEPFGRDYYLKGPEFERVLPAGSYKIEVFSQDNRGKYTLAVGKQEKFAWQDILSAYWILPTLKVQFFKTSVLEFLFTPFGLAAVGVIVLFLLLMAFINLIKFIIGEIKKNQPKVMLLTSQGMRVYEELKPILPKPADKIMAANVITASKQEEDPSYVDKETELLKQAGFHVEDVDIEGKNRQQLEQIFKGKDLIYVQGGNTFYLLKAMRQSGFDKIIKKLLKRGKIYVGVSAGSIVMGKSVKTGLWKDPNKNIVNLRNLKGLGLVPYNLFVHYTPEHEQIIKSKPRRQRRRLKILTDDQALLVAGRKMVVVGQGPEIKI